MKPNGILTLQKELAALGLDVGPIDGISGPNTAKALHAALVGGLLPFNGKVIAAAKQAYRDTPNRRTINNVYGTPKYKEAAKGRITILNADEWQRHFCSIDIFIDGMAKPISLTVNDGISAQALGAFAEIDAYNKTLPENERWFPKVVQAYCPRHNRWNKAFPLSVHTWAAAIDVDPKENGVGMKPTIPMWVVKTFESWGATWGGYWKEYPDPMHLQWMR